ncbi:Ig-like domain-containing protein [Serratia fonticola]|uniref:Ig-like domain-containing protein n=1 Tax=Serratia fonticola TaxID=47917 RepID=A0ABY9PT94_SERFO|nr:Ig-like domain-containing protein [Serratia fonticola]WMT16661.1 Ig-like domain-containing protein [Serratia fonticola]
MSLAYTPVVMAAKGDDEQTVATAATRLAGILASGDATKQAESIARGAVSGTANDAVGTWLNQFGTAKVKLNVDDKFSLKGSQLDVLLPLQDTPSLLTFSQLGTRYIDDRLTLNAGIGQRHFIDQQMFGYNLFLDRDIQGHHSRIGIGGEYARDYLRVAANGYFGVTGWKNSRNLDGFDEKAANGFDIRSEAYLPSMPQLGGKLVYEQYFGDDVGLFGKDKRQSDPSAVTVGLNYSPIPLVTLGAEHKQGTSGMNDSRFNLAFNYSFGTELSKQLDPANVGAKRTLAGSRYELVDRNNEIVLQYREQQVLSVTMAPLLQGDSGQTLELPITVNSKNGVASFEWQADGFTAAGGKIVPNGLGWQAVLPSYNLLGSNNYPISVTVIDRSGNRSEPAQGDIVVTGYGMAANSNLVIKNARLPADGRSTTQLELSLKDGSDRPIGGIAGQITLDSKFQPPSSASKISQASAAAQPTPHALGEITESADRPGVYLATFTAGSRAGVVKITANVAGTAIAVKEATVTLSADNATATIDENGLSGKVGNTVANGTDVNTVQLPVKDANGNPLPSVDVTFTVTAPDGSTRQQTVTTDANGIASLPVTSDQAGSVKVEAEVGGVTSSTELSFVADSSTATIDENGLSGKAGNTTANGTDVNTVQLPVKDAKGNPVPGVDVTFTVTNPDGSTRQQTVTTDANGIASLPVTSDQAGSVKVKAEVGGVTSSTELSFVADSSTATIDENGLTAEAGNTTANGTDVNLVTLPVKDANGNPVPGVDVTFTVTNPDGSTRQQTVTTDENGIASLPVTSEKAGSVKVEAEVGGVTSSTELSFVADSSTATIDENGLSGKAGNTTANGTDVNTVQLPVKDAKGNPVPGVDVTFTVTNPDGSTRQQTVTTDANGIASLPVTSDQAGSVKVEAEVGGVTSSTELSFVADSSTAIIDENGLTAEAGNTTANGTDVNLVTLPVKDANGNPVPGVDVTFTVTNPDGSTRQQTVTTDANGIASLPVTSDKAGSVKVEAEVGGVTSSTELSFVADSSTAIIDENGLSGKAGNTTANGTDVNLVTLPVKDANGNPVPGVDVTFTVTNPDGSTRQQTVTTDENGIASLPVTSDKAGSVKVEAEVGGVTSSTELSFVADSSTATIDENGLSGKAGNTTANGTDVNTVQLPVKDAKGNPVPGVDVTFTVTNPDGSTRQQTVTTDANGIASLPVTSDQAGSVKVKAEVGGVTSSTELSFVADSSTATIDENGLTAEAGNTTANGTDVNLVTLPVKDANGNPVPGVDVTFTVTNPDGSTRQQTVTTDENGIASLPVTSDKAGSVKVEAEVGGVTSSTELSFVADSSTATIDENGLSGKAGNTTANGTDVNTVQLPVKDAKGNPVPGVDVTFTVTNPDGSTRQQTVTTDENGIASLPVTSDQAGSVKVEAEVGGVTSSTELSFVADSSTATIDENGLTAEAGNTTANGTDVNLVKLPVKDAKGNPVPGVDVTFTVTNPDGSTRQQTVTTDANGIASLPVTSDQAGSVKVEAEVGGVTSSTELSFVADSSTATIDENGLSGKAGNTTANGTDVNTVQLPVKDAKGNPVPGVDVTFTVTNPDGSTRQQTVTTDANGIASLPVTSDQAGSVKVKAEVGGVTSSTELSFVADSSTATIDENGLTAEAGNTTANGTDVNLVTLPVKDANGNPVPGVDVTFTVTNPDGSTRQQTVTTDENGIASLPVTSEKAGSVKVEAEVGGVTSSTELSFVADSSTATIDENGLTAEAGNTTANGTDVNLVKLPVKDAKGNPVPGVDVTFTVTNPDGSTRQQTVTTDENGIASLPVTSEKAGSVKVEAEVGGVTSSTELSFVADSSTAIIDENGMTAEAGNTTANGTDVNTVQLPVKDAKGNPVPGVDVTFTVTNPDGSTRQQTVTTDENGIASLPVTSDQAGSVKVKAEVGGVTSSTELSFVADSSTATIDENGLSGKAGNTTANGTDVNLVKLPVKDAKGNPVPGVDVTFTVTNPDGSTRQQTVTTDENGIASLPVTSEKAGSVKVEAEVGGVTSSTELSFVADSSTATIDENGLSGKAGNTTANGTDVNTVQLPVKDAKGNPVPGVDVTFTVTNPDGSTRQQTVTTDANGIASLPVTSDQAGSVKVEAEVGGVTSSTELSFVADSSTATIDENGLTAEAGNTTANGTDVNTVQLPVKDAKGNPVPGVDVTFTVTNPDGSTRQQTVTTDENGIASLPVTSDKAGSVKVKAEVGGVTSSTELSFVADSSTATIDENGLSGKAGNTTANGTDVNTVQLPVKDAKGNPVPGVDVTFTVTNPDGSTRQQTVTTDANGIASLPVTSEKAGSVKVEAEVGGVTSSTELSFVADNSTAIIDENGMTAEAGNTTANGTDVNTVQLPVKDAKGNPVPGVDVTFTVTNPDGSTRQQTVTTDENGIASLPVTSDQAGSVKVEAEVGGVTSSTELSFVAGDVVAETSSLGAASATIEANGSDTTLITLTLKDGKGNPVTGQTVVLTTTLGTVGSITEGSNGVYTATLSAGMAAGVATLGATVGGSALGVTSTVTLAPRPIGNEQSSLKVSKDSINADDRTGSTITLTAKDTYGDAITGLAIELASDLEDTEITAVVDNNDGTYTARINGTKTGVANITVSASGTVLDGLTTTVTITPGAWNAAQDTPVMALTQQTEFARIIDGYYHRNYATVEALPLYDNHGNTIAGELIYDIDKAKVETVKLVTGLISSATGRTLKSGNNYSFANGADRYATAAAAEVDRYIRTDVTVTVTGVKDDFKTTTVNKVFKLGAGS